MLADHRLAAGASEGDVRNLLHSIFGMIVPVEVHYQWRPQLSEAGGSITGDKEMTPRVSTFSLRLPISLKAAAEKLSAILTAEAYFSALRGQGDPGGCARVSVPWRWRDASFRRRNPEGWLVEVLD